MVHFLTKYGEVKMNTVKILITIVLATMAANAANAQSCSAFINRANSCKPPSMKEIEAMREQATRQEKQEISEAQERARRWQEEALKRYDEKKERNAKLQAAAEERARISEAEMLKAMNPESLAIRKQYEIWARDNAVTAWTWVSVVGNDLDRATRIMLYDKECALVRAELHHRAQILLQASPDWAWSRPQQDAADMFERLGQQGWCRTTNPTPKPVM